MNCDSQTVYSTLYHHPVMTPKVVRSLGRDPLDEYFPRSSDQGSQQACMRCDTPTAMGYTFHQPLNHPHQHGTVFSPQNRGNITATPLSGQQTGGYSPGDYNMYATDRNTCSVDDNTMFLVSTNNNRVSGFSDNNYNPMYDVLLNVGQLQLSSYRMQTHTSATRCEQSYGGLDHDVDRQFLASQYRSVNNHGDSTFANPQKYYPAEPQHMTHTACRTPYSTVSHRTPYSTVSHRTPPNILPWQFSLNKDFRLWNVNHLLFSSSPADSLQNLADDSNRFRNEEANSNSLLNLGLKQYFRPGRETTPVQTPSSYVGYVGSSTDDDTWSTRTTQHSDTESLESFESGSSIRQIDMTASVLSEFSLYGPVSPESFRGDTPHPELWSFD
ncbi:uncharacterized protein LOC117322861 [Pecten maximus]|uniref:uncharacterized protein LOC117322861 n=1 Tax=Pecten maximus TaxID=6579 RepID=UPI0014581767|nr:uncharacterized protein LOC117322861 [Pecten maximus]